MSRTVTRSVKSVLVVLLAMFAFVLAGCGGTPHTAESPSPVAAAQATAPASAPAPTRVSIPKIGAESSLMQLGINADGTVQDPPLEKPMQAGWYVHGPSAGQVGPFVVLGHVDSKTQPGIFFRLKELKAGDKVLVDRADGMRITYTIDRMQQVSKSNFPTDAVYGDTPQQELRVITCGGAFDRKSGNYLDNIIAFGHMTGQQKI